MAKHDVILNTVRSTAVGLVYIAKCKCGFSSESGDEAQAIARGKGHITREHTKAEVAKAIRQQSVVVPEAPSHDYAVVAKSEIVSWPVIIKDSPTEPRYDERPGWNQPETS